MLSNLSVLFIGDIVGEESLSFLVENMDVLKEKTKPNFIIANGENIWQGKGLNEENAEMLFKAGVNVITTGNHVWENWKSRPLLAKNRNVLRPLNYPQGNPGYGFTFVKVEDVEVAVMQVQGRTYMQTIDCPFKGADFALKTIKERTNNIIVDFHAEATAEKMALGWHLDGQVSAVLGTHTHVPTADAQILPNGTAFLSDVGMTGPHDSVLGMRKEIAIKRYTLQTAHKYEMAEDDKKINFAHVNIDPTTGQAISINRYTYPEFENIDIALFSAGGETSKKYALIAAKADCIVIDNSSAFRMDPEVPLIVPEVNSDDIASHKNIIANPNCSTIQLVVALKPLDEKYGLKRVICSTYQSITGAGQSGLNKLKEEINEGGSCDGTKPIAFNTLFHPIEENGFTNEENKMVNETRKILGRNDLGVAYTCVRLPILGGHAESVNLELEKDFTIEDIKSTLSNSEGIQLINENDDEEYPTPLLADDTDPVYVGRIRKDHSVENGLYLWVVADNLRKGAALNAVQIAEHLSYSLLLI